MLRLCEERLMNIRCCCEQDAAAYRKVLYPNHYSEAPDAYPIPRMDECIDSLGNARVFSTLECNAGYWQIPVAEEDKQLTAFTCHSGA